VLLQLHSAIKSPPYDMIDESIILKVNFKSRGDTMNSLLSIGELADRSGVSASAIRYYESIGIMPIPERVSGKRRYTMEVLEQLKFIKTAQLTGFSNQEIAVLVEGFTSHKRPSGKWKQMADTKSLELEEKKKRIDTMLKILENGSKCECLTWSECFEQIHTEDICR